MRRILHPIFALLASVSRQELARQVAYLKEENILATSRFIALGPLRRTHGRYFIRNRENEVTAMLNRFDRIEPITVDTSRFPPYAYWSEGKGLVAFDAD